MIAHIMEIERFPPAAPLFLYVIINFIAMTNNVNKCTFCDDGDDDDAGIANQLRYKFERQKR